MRQCCRRARCSVRWLSQSATDSARDNDPRGSSVEGHAEHTSPVRSAPSVGISPIVDLPHLADIHVAGHLSALDTRVRIAGICERAARRIQSVFARTIKDSGENQDSIPTFALEETFQQFFWAQSASMGRQRYDQHQAWPPRRACPSTIVWTFGLQFRQSS